MWTKPLADEYFFDLTKFVKACTSGAFIYTFHPTNRPIR